jgi:hypothetical protein
LEKKYICVFYFVICLFTNTVFINSCLLGSIFTYGFNINTQNSNVVLCKLFYYISYLTSLYYPSVLILASFDRLLISSQNVDTRLYNSKRLAYFTISTSVILWTVFSFHILIKASYSISTTSSNSNNEQKKIFNCFVAYIFMILFILSLVLYWYSQYRLQCNIKLANINNSGTSYEQFFDRSWFFSLSFLGSLFVFEFSNSVNYKV